MDNESRSARFGALFEAALQAYEKKTDITLVDHPLAVQLHNFHSIESITTVLLGEAQAFKEFRGSDRVMKSIKSIVSILSRLFATASLNDAIDLVRQKLTTFATALTFFYSHFHLQKQYTLALLSYFLCVPFFRSYEDILVTSK
jgi:hypothetical protein